MVRLSLRNSIEIEPRMAIGRLLADTLMARCAFHHEARRSEIFCTCGRKTTLVSDHRPHCR